MIKTGESDNLDQTNSPDDTSGASALITVPQGGAMALMLDQERFAALIASAKFFADADLVPEHYRKKPANIAIAFLKAHRLGLDPFAYMEQSYVVKGRPAIQGQLAIALINERFLRSHGYRVPLKWEFSGENDTLRCVAYAEDHAGNRALVGPAVTMAMVKAEGWASNAKWKNMPEVMFQYRSAAFFARMYCSDVLLGMHTVDELDDAIETTGTTIDETLPPMPQPKGPQASTSVAAPPAGKASAAVADGKSAPKSAQPAPATGNGKEPTIDMRQVSEFWTGYYELFPKSTYGDKPTIALEVLRELGYGSVKEIETARFDVVMAKLRERAGATPDASNGNGSGADEGDGGF